MNVNVTDAATRSCTLHNSVVTGPIIDPRTNEQLQGNLCSLEIKLGAEVMKRLDTIWPGPGGEAPEAFAW